VIAYKTPSTTGGFRSHMNRRRAPVCAMEKEKVFRAIVSSTDLSTRCRHLRHDGDSRLSFVSATALGGRSRACQADCPEGADTRQPLIAPAWSTPSAKKRPQSGTKLKIIHNRHVSNPVDPLYMKNMPKATSSRSSRGGLSRCVVGLLNVSANNLSKPSDQPVDVPDRARSGI